MAPKILTRFDRVRQILDAAAGDSTSNYGGVGRPWRLTRDQLLTVEVYGVRMVAPAVEESAAPAASGTGCGCGCATTAERPGGQESGARFPRYPGRGAASGLVKGLRGQAPYDGSVFPRLPWGGTAVADADVQFISDWIDDGTGGWLESSDEWAAGENVAPLTDAMSAPLVSPSSGNVAMWARSGNRVGALARIRTSIRSASGTTS